MIAATVRLLRLIVWWFAAVVRFLLIPVCASQKAKMN